MKKKGFTLVELLAVIIIILTISLISVPVIINRMKGAEVKVDEATEQVIYQGASLYLDYNQVDYPLLSGRVYCITLQNLVDNNQLLGPLVNADGETIDLSRKVQVSVIDNHFSYSLLSLADSNNCTEVGDLTPPINVSVTEVSKTTNSITVSAKGTDPDSSIIRYEFSIDSGTYINNGTNKTYTFTEVSSGSHSIKTRVTNSYGLSTESTTVTISTDSISAPTYAINPSSGWATSKTVTINYPSDSGLTYTYSKDGASYISAIQGQEVIFTATGYVIARVTDGTNTVNGSTYNVSQVDSTAPSAATLASSDSTSSTVTAVYNAATDSESGISSYGCYYGTTSTPDTSGSLSGTTCTFSGLSSSTTYYFKICATNGVGLTTCSTVSSKDTSYGDTTPPVNVTVNEVSKTTNSITVSTSASDPDSGISKYEFSIDSGAYIDNGTTSSYTFTGVTTGSHAIKIRATNGYSLTTESTTSNISTNSISTPTYAISPASGWATSKTVTISYPSGSGLTYTYSKDGGAYVSATQSQNVVFTANGYVIARVSDGTNTVTASTYNVTGIDTTAPACSWQTLASSTITTVGSTTYTLNCTDVNGFNDSTITTSNITVNTAGKVTITGVTPATITNGYQYTVSISGAAAGTTTLSLVASAVADVANNGNSLITSSTITVVAPTYVWKKYNATTSGYTYSNFTTGSETLEYGSQFWQSSLCGVWQYNHTFASSYYTSSASGYVLNGSCINPSSYSDYTNWYYIGGGSSATAVKLCDYSTCYSNGFTEGGCYYTKYMSSNTNPIYAKGTTYYGEVTSTNRSAYPDNGYSGGYWYVYDRAQ